MKKFIMLFVSILVLTGCSSRTSMEKKYDKIMEDARINGYVMEIKNSEVASTITVESKDKFNVLQTMFDEKYVVYCGYDVYDPGDAMDLSSEELCSDERYDTVLEEVDKLISDAAFPEDDKAIEYKKSKGYSANGKSSEGKKFTLKVNDKIVYSDGDNTVTISKKKK